MKRSVGQTKLMT